MSRKLRRLQGHSRSSLSVCDAPGKLAPHNESYKLHEHEQIPDVTRYCTFSSDRGHNMRSKYYEMRPCYQIPCPSQDCQALHLSKTRRQCNPVEASPKLPLSKGCARQESSEPCSFG